MLELRNGGTSHALNFNTRALPCFTNLHKQFYNNLESSNLSRIGKKGIPQNIFHLLDSIALAHWIQEDGYRHGEGLRLATHSFSIQETVLLVNVLIIKFDLNCTIIRIKNSDQFVIYIRTESMDKLRALVTPYMHPSMMYKIEKDLSVISKPFPKAIHIWAYDHNLLIAGSPFTSIAHCVKALNTWV